MYSPWAIPNDPRIALANMDAVFPRKGGVGMTMDEAIKQLQAVTQADERDFPIILEDAMKLGIEALKRVKWHKDQHERGYYELLPGETEE